MIHVFIAFILVNFYLQGTVTAVNPQNPPVWDALNALRGKDALGAPEIQELLFTVVAGVDFPIFSSIPKTGFQCASVGQPGYYADTEARCQLFHRCDLNGNITSYLCPNMTLFNQITLICDWFYNVDCGQSKNFYGYSNLRLYAGEEVRLLDDQEEISTLRKTLVKGAVRANAGQLTPQYGDRHENDNVNVDFEQPEQPKISGAAVQVNAHSRPGLGPIMVSGEARSSSSSQWTEKPMQRRKEKRGSRKNV